MVDREGPIHRSILQWLRLALPHAMIHHSANEGVRSGARGMLDGKRKKAMGQVAGFPDIVVFPWSHLPVMFFEVKAPGGYASEAQKAIHEQLRVLGYRVALVRSIDDVSAALAEWGIACKVR